jgi:hypothetical protein
MFQEYHKDNFVSGDCCWLQTMRTNIIANLGLLS